MTQKHLKQVDTVIVGSGPSALILSYILHGHVPVYDVHNPHPDPILHAKLIDNIDLLTANVDRLTEHFYGSRFSYSTQALPVNVLLDTLVRPYGETDEADKKTCIKWVYDPARVVPHIVFGKTKNSGGQWADNPVDASWDIGALSYAGMLSLPGYSFQEYYASVRGEPTPFYLRPTRRDVAGYLAAYPSKAGIAESIRSNEEAKNISRCNAGFLVQSHGLFCKNLVLASGTFTKPVPARPLLQPLFNMVQAPKSKDPILVVGSGFSAADVILSTPRDQKIIHIFKWAPNTNPSPLRACHQQAYPEYAGVYRRMKLAASASASASTTSKPRRPSGHRLVSELESSRDWETAYQGLPNTAIIKVEPYENFAIVTFLANNGATFQRKVGSFAWVVGRRGSLTYLESDLRKEICSDNTQWDSITGATLRERVSEELELAPHVFVVGSLTGDSLIRFAYGACAYAAGRIMQDRQDVRKAETITLSNGVTTDTRYYVPVMNGLQGHGNQHSLQLDRRKSEIRVEGA